MNLNASSSFHGKYLITKFAPILFAHTIIHSEIKIPALSAGYFYLKLDSTAEEGFEVICYGESESLGIESHPPKDSKLIKEMLLGGFTKFVTADFYKN